VAVTARLPPPPDTTILISSHELSEIEGFTTHVAFMVNGRLMLQESIEDLRMRFREVRVTLSGVKEPAQPLPDAWLLPETEGHHLRFFASDYEDDDTLQRQLAQRFGAVRMECDHIPLRTIANALMQHRKRSLPR
jgi:ABC-2 type transport system ATP-binding protein